MNLNKMMQNGTAGILKTVGRFYLKNAKGRAFLASTVPRILQNEAIRDKHEKAGHHIPPFLIASIASQCNLRCAGCYARAGGCCAEAAVAPDLTDAEWGRIFDDAADLGVSFVLLAGGEPLLRRGVLDRAARCASMIFPVFTNGTMLDAGFVDFFDENRNLIPVLSIEGNEAETDARRGTGVFASVHSSMGRLAEKHILFGASVTVTRDNLDKVLDESFVEGLRAMGCGVLFYVEYVPSETGTEHLALRGEEPQALQMQAQALKKQFRDMVILSFPGDEEAMGGCLASGRGFFHINPNGGAEPCPFSPYAEHNLREASILEVLDSRYFAELRKLAVGEGPHSGGCVLFEKESAVRALLANRAEVC